jgi:hypothetical protein
MFAPLRELLAICDELPWIVLDWVLVGAPPHDEPGSLHRMPARLTRRPINQRNPAT